MICAHRITDFWQRGHRCHVPSGWCNQHNKVATVRNANTAAKFAAKSTSLCNYLEVSMAVSPPPWRHWCLSKVLKLAQTHH